MEGMGRHMANDKRAPSESTSEERPRKIKRPPEAVSIFPGRTRSSSEVAGHGQRLHIWKHGVSPDRLEVVWGVVVVGFGLIGGRRETRSYKIISLPDPRGRWDLSVVKAEAKKVFGKNCEGV